MPTAKLHLLAALCLAFPVTGHAQQLEPGARIRVRPSCEYREPCYPIIGQFRSIVGDTLVIERVDGGTESLLLTPGTRLDLSHGYRRRILEGVGVGMVAGIVAGYIGKVSCEGPGSSDDSLCGLYYLLTVPPGILLGGIVGAHLKVERWLPAAGPRFAAVPLRGGVGLGMRVGF